MSGKTEKDKASAENRAVVDAIRILFGKRPLYRQEPRTAAPSFEVPAESVFWDWAVPGSVGAEAQRGGALGERFMYIERSGEQRRLDRTRTAARRAQRR